MADLEEVIAVLRRIERNLDDMDRRLKAVEQDMHRVKIEARARA